MRTLPDIKQHIQTVAAHSVFLSAMKPHFIELSKAGQSTHSSIVCKAFATASRE